MDTRDDNPPAMPDRPAAGPSDSVLHRIEGFAQTQHDSGYQNGYLECYRDIRKATARVGLFALLLGIVLGGVIALFAARQGVLGDVVPTPAPKDPREYGAARGTRFLAAAEFAQSYTVGVVADTENDPFSGERARTSGSGFFLDERGYAATNWHVVNRSERVWVIWNDRRYQARVVGGDARLDVAVIKINVDKVPAAAIPETNEAVAQAEEVLAIGSPFGLKYTVTQGIISYVGRLIDGGTIPYLQTDASINSGNSGGPLVNLEGRVVGMTTMIFSRTGESSGVGFAIPISIVQEVARAVIGRDKDASVTAPVDAGEPAELPYIGVEFNPLHVQGPPRVVSIMRNSPADLAGIRPGDVLHALNGVPIRSYKELTYELWDHNKPGDEVVLTIKRGGETLKVPVRLSVHPNPQ